MNFWQNRLYIWYRLQEGESYLGQGGVWQKMGQTRLSPQPQKNDLQFLAAGLDGETMLFCFAAPGSGLQIGDGLTEGTAEAAALPVWQVQSVKEYGQHDEIVLKKR